MILMEFICGVCATVNREMGVYGEKMLMILLPLDEPHIRTFHGVCNVAFYVDCTCHGPICVYSCNDFSVINNKYSSFFISPSSRVNTKSSKTHEKVVKPHLIRSDDMSFEIANLLMQHDPHQTSVSRIPIEYMGTNMNQMDRCDEADIGEKSFTYKRRFQKSYLSKNKVKEKGTGTNMDQTDRSDETNIGENNVTYKRCFKKSYLSTNIANDKGTVHRTEMKGVNTYLDKLRMRPGPFKDIAYKRTSDVAFRITIMLLLTATLSCDAAPVQKNMLSFPTLTSDRCDREFLLTKRCQIYGSEMYKLQLKNCAFQCDMGYEPRCVPIADGSVFICVPKSFMCPPGVIWSPSLTSNSSTSLTIKVEECQVGFYQPTNSYCFEACTDKHRDISIMPNELVLYSKGDVKSSTKVYCNHLEGYYNADGHTLMDYDQEYAHTSDFCSNVSQMKIACTVDQQLLPNGTCVSLCEEGSERDVYSEFTCKKGVYTRQWTTTTVKPVTSPHPEATTNTSIPETTKVLYKEETLGGEAVNPKVVAAIIGGVLILLVILIVIVVIRFVRRRRKILKNRKEGGQVGDIESQQSHEVPGSETASHMSSKGSSKGSYDVVYTTKKETNAENIIKVGNNSNVQVHLHYNTSSSSVAIRTNNVGTHSAIHDNHGGPTQTEFEEPLQAGLSNDAVLKIDSVLPSTDVQNSDTTDISETTALLSECSEKTGDHLTRASLFEYPEGEKEPANKSEDKEKRETLLTGFQPNDNGPNEEENTDRKTIPEQSHVERESNITENTKRKLLISQIDSHTGGNRLCDEHREVSDFCAGRRIDIGSLATDYDENSGEERTERKKVHSDGTPTERRNDLTDCHRTKRKEMVSASGDSSFGGMCGLEAESHFFDLNDDRNNQLPTENEQASANCMESLKDDIGILGNTRLISSTVSDVGLAAVVAERSLEDSVSSRSSSTETKSIGLKNFLLP